MSSPRPTVLLLLGQGESSEIVRSHLARALPEADIVAVVESRPTRRRLALRRARRLGWRTALGQVVFSAVIVPLLRATSAARITALRDSLRVEPEDGAGETIKVDSVNDPEVRDVIARVDPGVVVVNGTRIIGRETLAVIGCPIINTHAGITPTYRGVHGGYWALAEGHPDLVGTTVHRVDPGIDTGGVLAQATFDVTEADSFVTYPYLHLQSGLPLLISAVRAALNGSLEERPSVSTLPSVLRYHPTAWGYVWTRLRKQVR